MTVVAVIPARGGSKRLPGKNIRPCAGKPLLAWTCDAARAARTLDRVLLSTDDEAIAAVGRSCGVEVPFLRPRHLAADDTPTLPVLLHLLDWLETAEPIDALVLLQPTSPLRVAADIDGAVDLLHDSGADSVVTVTPLPDHFGPGKWMLRNGDGSLERPSPADLPAADRLMVRNGPAVVVMRPGVLRTGSLYGNRVVGYEMPPERSIDIDTPLDFALAEALLARS